MRPTRGIALVTVLLLTSVVIMMVVSLLYLSRSRAFSSRQFHERTLCLYVAEGGINAALQALSLDRDWQEGFSEQGMTQVPGQYSMQFFDGVGTPERDDSVNNLLGTAAADSYHGEGTVPPGSALLIAIARVGTSERRIEVLVGSPSSVSFNKAMLASGDISLLGNVDILGIQTLLGREETNAGVHSNASDGSISWQQKFAER